MKFAGWIAGVLILLLFIAACEIVTSLKGNEFVVEVAGVCVFLVWGALTWKIANWADREIQATKVRK